MSENFDSKYCYDYIDIYILLNDLCMKHYFVCEPTSMDNFHLSKTIQNACEQLNNNDQICTVVIPINLGFVNYGIYQGSHWVGLVIKLNSKKLFEAMFADSLGNSIDNSIIIVLKKFGIAVIDSSMKQQTNAFDCGPWTVFNLDSLAKTGKLPINIDNKMIIDQRLHLINLSENFDKSLLNIPDIVNFENSHVINEDIEKIKTIFNILIKYEKNLLDLKTTLIEIGKLAEQLYYNDKGDKDSRCIRNKYGYIQRNKGKLINKNGIYFEKLYQLSVILKDDEMFSSIPLIEFEELQTQLPNLKLKISYILKQEVGCDYSELNCDMTISIFNLTNFATYYYGILTVKKIRDELEKLESIDFQIKDDRYYFARIFGIIGERVNELLENQNDFKTHTLWIALKNIIEIRNKIIHFHKIIRDGIPNSNLLINDIILKIKSHLIEIVANKEIDFNYSKINEFHYETKILMESLFAKSKKSTNCNNLENSKKEKLKELSNEEIENLLKKLISKACDFIEKFEISNKNFQQKSIEKQLESINKQYQIYLIKLNVEKRKDYPFSLEYFHRDEIVKYNQNIPVQITQPMKNKESNNEKLQEKIGLFKVKVLILKDEVEYLLSISDLRIFQRKYFYIIQQIMLVIGQLMKDIEDLKICEKANETSLERENFLLMISPYFKNFTDSILLNEGKVISKKSRNCLAHRLWSFDEKKFFEELKDILCVFPHLESFISIMEKDDLPLSVKMLHNVGVSFSEIGLYEEAIDYLNRALLKFNDCPISISADDDNAKNYKLVFGLERPIYRIQRNLVTIMLFAKHTSEAYRILNEIKCKIDHSALEKCDDNDIKLEVSSVYCDMSWFLKEQRNYDEAIGILENAEQICEDFLTKINLAQAYFLNGRKEKAIELCNIIYKDDPDIIGKFQALNLLISIMFEYSDDDDDAEKVNKISQYIRQMENLLQNDIRSFKSLFRDRYLWTKLELIQLESDLLIEKSYENLEKGINDRFDFDKLNKLDIEFNNILSKLKNNLLGNSRVTTLFFNMCCCYCCIFNDLNIDFDKNGENLIKAQKYFDKGLENIKQFPELSIDIINDSAEVAISLSRAYNNYVLLRTEKLDMKTRIEHLEKALKLQEKYEITKITTLNNLGLQYLNNANDHVQLYQIHDKDEIYNLALKNYEKAIKYYNWKLKEQQLEYRNSSDNEEIFIDTKISLAYCYFGISSFKYDLFFMGETVNYFNELLKFSFSEKEKFYNYKSVIEQFRLVVIEVLKDILNPMFKHNELRNANPFAVKFCQKKFGIQIILNCGYLKWKINENADLNFVKYQVKQELDKTTEEFILLYKFYKILLMKGFIYPKQ